jgi:hypothetical protein
MISGSIVCSMRQYIKLADHHALLAEALCSYEGTYQMENLIVGKAITGLGTFV